MGGKSAGTAQLDVTARSKGAPDAASQATKAPESTSKAVQA